ncbi:hypothetical protein DAI22_03g049250 [Oryza sativa Japonica Group]|nr:hypothetical protein DAI22_03g049250 [Oryza sativa Japonica Group]
MTRISKNRHPHPFHHPWVRVRSPLLTGLPWGSRPLAGAPLLCGRRREDPNHGAAAPRSPAAHRARWTKTRHLPPPPPAAGASSDLRAHRMPPPLPRALRLVVCW